MSVKNNSTRTTLASEVPAASQSRVMLSMIASACASDDDEKCGCRGFHRCRRYQPIAIGRHQRRDEQKIARLHGLRLLTERGRHAGVDMALAGRAAGFAAITLISILPS